MTASRLHSVLRQSRWVGNSTRSPRPADSWTRWTNVLPRAWRVISTATRTGPSSTTRTWAGPPTYCWHSFWRSSQSMFQAGNCDGFWCRNPSRIGAASSGWLPLALSITCSTSPAALIVTWYRPFSSDVGETFNSDAAGGAAAGRTANVVNDTDGTWASTSSLSPSSPTLPSTCDGTTCPSGPVTATSAGAAPGKWTVASNGSARSIDSGL